MKRFYLFFGLALCMLTVGCSKDDPKTEPDEPTTKEAVNIIANAVDELGLWQEGAKIAVNGVESKEVAIDAENPAKGVFAVEKVAAPFVVIAPFSAYEAGDIVKVPDTQNYVAGGHDADAYLMYGYAEKFDETELEQPIIESRAEEIVEVKTATVDMQSFCGIIALPLTVADGAVASIKSIDMTTGNDAEMIAGSWKFNVKEGAVTVEKPYDTIVLDCGEGVALGAEPTVFRFVVPAGKYTQGVYFTIEDKDGHKDVCEFKDEINVVAGEEYSVAAAEFHIIEKAAATLNITINEAGIKWAAGDKVVINGQLSSEIAAEEAGTSTGTFNVENVARPYKVLYPQDLYTTSGRLRLYNEQRLIANDCDREALAMVGYSTTTDVTMHNVCGLIKIPVTNNYETDNLTITKIDIRSNDGTPLCGKFNINYRNATLSTVSEATELSLVPAEGSKGILLPVGESVNVYAVVPEGRFPKGITLDVYTDVGAQTDIACTPSGGMNITRGEETGVDMIEFSDIKIEKIMTADELLQFANGVNLGRYKRFINDEGEVVLGGDIDMSTIEWAEITGVVTDGVNAGFDGIFNGNGFKITNWTSSKSLFATLARGGVVKNLVIDASCQLTYPNPNELGKVTYFGFVVGENLGGTIESVINNANISLNMSDALGYQLRAGAIVGQSQIGSRITKCENHGNINLTFTGGITNAATSASCTQYFGGVSGAITSGDTSLADDNDRSIMQNCVNTGSLTVNVASTLKHGCYLGGVTATANSYTEMYDCSNSGDITFDIPAHTSITCMGGVTSYSAGKIERCNNSGKVALKNSTTMRTFTVAGVVGYMNGTIADCNNEGVIDVDIAKLDKTGTIGGIDGKKSKTAGNGSVGGIVGFAYGPESWPFSATNCINRGAIKVSQSDSQGSLATGRFCIAGCIAAPWGDIDGCKNYGNIDVTVTNKSNTQDASTNLITYIGGIAGADHYPLTQSETSISNCENEGNITAYLVCSKSNSAIGGIIAWPGVEGAAQTNVTSNSINRGSINVTGFAKARVGGIQGGSGSIVDCTNYADLTMDLPTGSCLGGVGGFHTQNHYIHGGSNYGNVTSLSKTVYVGGMCGNVGNVENTNYGGVIKCAVVAPAESTAAGYLVGNLSGTKNLVFGTDEAPIQVKGSLTVGNTTTKVETVEEIINTVLFGTNNTGTNISTVVTPLVE